MSEKTPRQRLAKLLTRGDFTVEQMARSLDAPVQRILDDLEHVRRSTGDRFEMLPPECKGCGFVFDDRTRLGRPSRCPECRQERIDGPWFHVEPES
jgi:predicted Zn-ribbon and HTH transcriptional regulator